MNFIFLGLVLYGIAVLYGAVTHDSIIKHTIRCAYCRKEISSKVCTQLLYRTRRGLTVDTGEALPDVHELAGRAGGPGDECVVDGPRTALLRYHGIHDMDMFYELQSTHGSDM